MKIVYAVEIGDCGERVYYKGRLKALNHGKREKRNVFRCQLAHDAVIQLLNQQGGFIEDEVNIYRTK